MPSGTPGHRCACSRTSGTARGSRSTAPPRCCTCRMLSTRWSTTTGASPANTPTGTSTARRWSCRASRCSGSPPRAGVRSRPAGSRPTSRPGWTAGRPRWRAAVRATGATLAGKPTSCQYTRATPRRGPGRKPHKLSIHPLGGLWDLVRAWRMISMLLDTPMKELLFTTVYIRVETAEGGAIGTGFIYNAARGGASTPVLITNKHVIAGATKGTIRLMSRRGDEPDLGNPIEVEYEDFLVLWVGHPSNDVDV